MKNLEIRKPMGHWAIPQFHGERLALLMCPHNLPLAPAVGQLSQKNSMKKSRLFKIGSSNLGSIPLSRQKSAKFDLVILRQKNNILQIEWRPHRLEIIYFELLTVVRFSGHNPVRRPRHWPNRIGKIRLAIPWQSRHYKKCNDLFL